ncbi:peptidoglycan recognition family protein [Bacillus manliponensis]|uniref:peptidoglycan recognition protein family protein n=1 Tax=Bacillus manliponensis TaxID=574376 RepID=UPI00068F0DB8|nr:peptidoglycan recognition family protein [Bacillus manliponensis]
MNIVDMRGKLRSNGSYEDYGASSKTTIVVHHSLTKTGSAEAYARYHVDVNGWSGIGYQFVIEQNGTIKQCQNIGANSYHVGNHNKYCVGICLTGDFRIQEPTAAQRCSLYELITYLQKTYPNLKYVKGHSDLKGYEWKDCPCFDYNRVLREEAAGGSIGSKPLQPTGIGLARSKYEDGYNINLFNSGEKDAWVTGHVINKTYPYLILEGRWYGGDENMLCLGWEKWAKQEHFNVQWFYAYSKFPSDYGINTFDAPNGNFKGRVFGHQPLGIYARRDEHIDIGQNTWIPEKHFDIR